MTMSCSYDDKALLAPPSSPEKTDARDAHKTLTDALVALDAEQEQQTIASSYTLASRKRSTSVHVTEPKWEPTDAELAALAMQDFAVIGVLGVGTYGVVKLARHIASGASVALKVLSKEHIVSMRQEKHILRERAVHLELQHAFIARLYGTFQDADCLYLVIEYLPGGELWSLVYSDFDNNDGSDSESERVVPDASALALANKPALGSTSSDAQDTCDDQQQQQQHAPATGVKDTEARSCSPTEDAEPRTLTQRLALKLVLSDDSEQHRALNSPLRRRSPKSPAHVVRLDAKSRGLLRSAHGGLKEDHAVFYLASILSALEYLHAQGLLYRDLKLENLVLDRMGYPKVLDFGFAKPNATSTTTAPPRNMTLCGSMDYMAPEILRHEPHDERVDIWSFGIIMYELLLGKTPFYHTNPREVGRRITSEPVAFPDAFEREHPAACDLIRKLLVKAPCERLASMRAVKSHAFFSQRFPDAAAWDALTRKELRAPFVPKLAGPFDTSFFETMDSSDGADDDDAFDDSVEPYFEDGSHIFRAF